MARTKLSVWYYNTTDSRWYEARTYHDKNALRECTIYKTIANPSEARFTLVNPSKDPTSTDSTQSQGFLTNIFNQYTHVFIKDNSTGLILFRGRAYDVKERYDMGKGAILEIKAYDALKELQNTPTSQAEKELQAIDMGNVTTLQAKAFDPAKTVSIAIGSVTASGSLTIVSRQWDVIRISSVTGIEVGDTLKINDEKMYVNGIGVQNWTGSISSTADGQNANDLVVVRGWDETTVAGHSVGAAVTRMQHSETQNVDGRRSGLIRYIISRSRANIKTEVGMTGKQGISEFENSEYKFTVEELASFSRKKVAGTDAPGALYGLDITKDNLLQEIHSFSETDPWDSDTSPTHRGYDYYLSPNIIQQISHGLSTSFNPNLPANYPTFNYFKRGTRPGLGGDGITNKRTDAINGIIRNPRPQALPITTVTANMGNSTGRGVLETVTVGDTTILKALAKAYETSIVGSTHTYKYTFKDRGSTYNVKDGFVLKINDEELVLYQILSATSIRVFRAVNASTEAPHTSNAGNDMGLRTTTASTSSPDVFGLTLWYPSSSGSNSYSNVGSRYRGTLTRPMKASSTFDYEEMSSITALHASWTQLETKAKALSDTSETTAHTRTGRFEKLPCKLGVETVGGNQRVYFADDLDSASETEPLGRKIWDADAGGDWCKYNPHIDMEAQALDSATGKGDESYLANKIHTQSQFLYAGVRDSSGNEAVSTNPCAVIVYAAANTNPDEDLYDDYVILRYIHEKDNETIEHDTSATQTLLREAHRTYYVDNYDMHIVMDPFPNASDLPDDQTYIRLYGEAASGQAARPYLKFIPSDRPKEKYNLQKTATYNIPNNYISSSLILKSIANALHGNMNEMPITSHTEIVDYPYVKLIIEPENISNLGYRSDTGYNNNVLYFKNNPADASKKAFLHNASANGTTNDLFYYGVKAGAVIAELDAVGNVSRYAYIEDYKYLHGQDQTNLYYGLNMLDTSDGGQLRTTAQVATSTVPSQSANTDINVTSGKGAKYNVDEIIRIGDEYMYILAISGDVLTVQRGYSLTTPATTDTGSIAAHSVGANIINWKRMAIFIPTETGHSIRIKHPKLNLDINSLVQSIELEYSQGYLTTYMDSIGLQNSVSMPTQTSYVRNPGLRPTVMSLYNSNVEKSSSTSVNSTTVPNAYTNIAQQMASFTLQNGVLKPHNQSTMALVSQYKTKLAAAITTTPAKGTKETITIDNNDWIDSNGESLSPAPQFKPNDILIVGTEELFLESTASSGASLTVLRGFNDTTPATHLDNAYISKRDVRFATPYANINIKISDPDINGGLSIVGTDTGDADSLHEKHMVFYRPYKDVNNNLIYGGSYQLQAYPIDRHDYAVADDDKMPLWAMGNTLGDIGGYRDATLDIEFGIAQYRADMDVCYWDPNDIINATHDTNLTPVKKIATNGLESIKLRKGNQAWTTDILFEADAAAPDYNKIRWHQNGSSITTNGSIRFADGTTETINYDTSETMGAGAKYIYKVTGASASATLVIGSAYSDAIGDDKILLAVVITASSDDDSECPTILPFNGNTPTLSTGALATGAVLAGHIQANVITTKITSDMAGVTMNAAGQIMAGKTEYGSGTGYILESNHGGSGTPKFDIGSTSQYMRWTGSAVDIKGDFSVANGEITIKDDGIKLSTGVANQLVFNVGGTGQMQQFYNHSTGYLTFSKTNSEGGVYVANILSTSSGVTFTGLGTSGTPAAFIQIQSDGTLMKSTSSRKYKENIVDMTTDSSKVLNLRPVNFKYKDYEQGDKIVTGRSSFGLIAEEVHEEVPEIVLYDSDNTPDALDYPLMTVLLLAEVKKLRVEIDALKNG